MVMNDELSLSLDGTSPLTEITSLMPAINELSSVSIYLSGPENENETRGRVRGNSG